MTAADPFDYVDGRMTADGVPLADVAAAVGTPVYVYAATAIEARYRAWAAALDGLDARICYAVKANGNLAVIATLARLGCGADVVSGGELTRALAGGVPADRIVFSGVGKTREEMAQALDAGVRQINVESEPELDALSEVAGAQGRTAAVSLRVNPDVDARTHAKITTGKSENKFGIDWRRAPDIYARAMSLPGIRATGIAVHIGSQLRDLEPYRQAYARIAELVNLLRSRGHGVDHLDLGGGLGIAYGDEIVPTPDAYGAVVRDTVGDLGCGLVVEPGRSMVGNAGVLLTRVLYVKVGATRRFVISDAAMNDLIRPALYDAHHRIQPVNQPGPGVAETPADVVGPVCETGDTFARAIALPPVESGDLLMFRSAGAYGAVMASTYNARPLVPEAMVRNGSFAVVRERVTIESMLAHEFLPPWLGDVATPLGRTAEKRG